MCVCVLVCVCMCVCVRVCVRVSECVSPYLSSPVLLSPPQSSSVLFSPPQPSSILLSPPQSSSVLLSPPLPCRYFYYLEVDARKPGLAGFYEFVGRGVERNPLAREFGVVTEAQLGRFVKTMADFMLILVTERLMDGLVVFGWELNWRLWDLSHMRVLDSHAGGTVTRHHKHVKPTPHTHIHTHIHTHKHTHTHTHTHTHQLM